MRLTPRRALVFCDTCGHLVRDIFHTCPPVWLVRCTGNEDSEQRVYAHTPADAAGEYVGDMLDASQLAPLDQVSVNVWITGEEEPSELLEFEVWSNPPHEDLTVRRVA